MRKAILAAIICTFIFQPLAAMAVSTNYRFTGQQLDPEIDLYYFGQRNYNSSSGRFIQPDPLQNYLVLPLLKEKTDKNLEEVLSDPQNLNGYSYSSNNPVNFIDPTGEFNWETGAVEAGDSLSGVFGARWQEVAQYNHLKNPNLIYPGQILNVPFEKPKNLITESLDLGSALMPGISDLRDVAEVLYGKDVVSGDKLSYAQRGEMIGLALLPLVSGAAIKKIKTIGEKLASAVNRAVVKNKTIKKIFKQVGLKPEKVMDKLNLPVQLEKATDKLSGYFNDFGQRFIRTIFRR